MFIKKIFSKFHFSSLTIKIVIGAIVGSIIIYLGYLQFNLYLLNTDSKINNQQLTAARTDLEDLKNQDQYQRNEKLQAEINDLQRTFSNSLSAYEKLTDLKNPPPKLTSQYAKVLSYLSARNYSEASKTLATLNQDLETEIAKSAPASAPAASAVSDNKPPDSGYRRQTVTVDGGNFTVDIISADLSSTRVIVDTASDNDCSNNCPVMSLGDYASRSGAFAGINGSFFCPESYPTCAGKTNSYDTLLMNKNKKYFNSDNNVYSVVPAVIFSGNGARFVSRSLEWGRDTGVDAVLANYPLLLTGGNAAYTNSDDPKITGKGSRCFVGINGSKVYIGIVHNATTSDEVKVLKTLGIQDALGLDQGGSTALWYQGGYKAGPGRNIPNALLFVKK